MKHEELHPFMRKIVKKITELNEPEDEVSLDGESAGGSFFCNRIGSG